MDTRSLFFSLGLFLLCAHSVDCVSAQVQKQATNTDPQDGYLTLRNSHIAWPSPESLIKDLQGDNDAARLRAANQLGIDEGSDAKSSPEEVLLRYATLGANWDEQTVIAVEYGSSRLYGAVAVQKGGTWERVATFYCWCKYGIGDLLEEFIRVEPAPDGRSELVLRASGGGTGIYTQDESHFRYFHGELRRVLYFVNHARACDPTAPGPYTCKVERRWFINNSGDPSSGSTLVEANLDFQPNGGRMDVEFEVEDLQIRHAKAPSCRPYKWNAREFTYQPIGAPVSCKERRTRN